MLSLITCEEGTAGEEGRFMEPHIFSAHGLANGELPKTKRGRERSGQRERTAVGARECLL
jgi:hypothetical protein